MKRPEPKAELSVIVVGRNRALKIDTSSRDALDWILSESPAFGDLLSFGTGRFFLYVSELYNAEEVADYLRQEEA